MTSDTASILAAVATAFAALAAWCSFEVARRSLDFQKKYAKNQNLINELNRTIYKAETLQILIPKPLELSDEQYESIEPLLEEIKSELERFNNRSVIEYTELSISSVNSKYDLARDNSSLAEVISTLESVKSNIFD